MMDDSSPVKTACVYERRLSEVEKLQRKTDILIHRLQEAENKNNKLIEEKKESKIEIESLKRSMVEKDRENAKLAEKLSRFEEYELLELLTN